MSSNSALNSMIFKCMLHEMSCWKVAKLISNADKSLVYITSHSVIATMDRFRVVIIPHHAIDPPA